MRKIKKAQTGADTSARKFPSGMITPSKKEMRSMPKYSPRKIERKDRQATKEEIRNLEKNKPAMPASQKNIGRKGIKVKKAKGGKEMIKRADGSYSQRGLWDNIRANRGSGKKPTAAMLKQERKIKAKGK